MGAALAFADSPSAEFELEFVAADGVVLRQPLSQCWHERFENSRQTRLFPTYKGQANFSGAWWFATTGEHVGYESWLERDNVMVLDFDPRVVGLASQPFWLHWPAENGWRRHAPDFFVRFEDGTAEVVDVRADDRIESRDAEAFAATELACQQVGWGFRRVGVVDPFPPPARPPACRWRHHQHREPWPRRRYG